VRKLIFLIIFILSLGAGLAYGWVIQPAMRTQNPLNSLREDYRADYTLMTAELYSVDGDLDAAFTRMTILDPDSPTQAALLAAAYARQVGYSINDLDLMMTLGRDMQSRAPVQLEAVP
jgi:hypothetical protein